MNKRVTLKDIAKATGVHVSTVSRALDPNRGTSITSDVVQKVQKAAKDLGYRPNRVAYSLRTNRTMTVGVMIPDITNTLFPPMVRGIESVMEPAGYASILVNTDNQAGREVGLLGTLQDRGVDGIIHAAAFRSEPSILEAVENGLSVVTLNRKIEASDIPYVINDEGEGICLLFAHLYQAGHRRIAHIAGPQDLSTGQLRQRAFENTAKKHGLEPSSLPIVCAERFDEEQGRILARQVLQNAPDTTALLCANDRLALGAMQAITALGLECPGDVSVTGFNDMPLLDLVSPGLTTVRIQQFSAGERAARTLLQMLQGNGEDIERAVVMPVKLVSRASVAPPRGEQTLMI